MATSKVTVTLPDEQLARIRELVTAGAARNVSAFVKHAVAVTLADVTDWQALVDQSLAETGGPVTDQERRWAEEVLGIDSTASTA